MSANGFFATHATTRWSVCPFPLNLSKPLQLTGQTELWQDWCRTSDARLEEAISDCLALSQSNCIGALWAIWKDQKPMWGKREGNWGGGRWGKEVPSCSSPSCLNLSNLSSLEVKYRHLWDSSSIYHPAITYKNSEPDHPTKPLLNSWPQKQRPSLSHLPIDPH